MNRQRLIRIVKIIVSVGLITFILSLIDINQMGVVLQQVNLFWLLAAIIVSLVNIVVRAIRWQVLLRAIAVKAPLSALIIIYFIGAAFNNLLPSGVGGDAIRAVELNRYTSRVSDAVTSVVVDRFLGLYGSLLLGFMTLPLAWQQVPFEVTAASILAFAGLTVIGIMLMHEPSYRFLHQVPVLGQLAELKGIRSLFQSFQGYSLRAIFQAFMVGLVVNVLLIMMNMTIGIGLNLQISLIFYLVFVPLVNLTLALPISFAGFGAREVVYITLFAGVGVLQEQALALSLLVYAVGNLAPGFVGGLLYLWRNARGLNQIQLEKTE